MESIIIKEDTKKHFLRALKNGSILISAPCGYGKTSMVKALLKENNRPYIYLSAKSRDFSDRLSKMGDALAVIDDLHLCREEELARISQRLQLPGVSMILISRSGLPSQLKKVFIGGGLQMIGEKELRMGILEVSRLTKDAGAAVDLGQAGELLRATDGYPLAVKICARYLQSGQPYGRELTEKVKWDLYDYYDARLFCHWSEELQAFLINLAAFPQFDRALAEAVCGGKNALALLQTAEREGCLKPGPGEEHYRIQPVLLSYLQDKQQMVKEETRRQVYESAGSHYEAQGQLVEALECYRHCGCHDKVVELLTENFRRHPGTGHYYEMEKYYFSLPEEKICGSAQLMCGMSLLCAMCMRFEESEYWYDKLKTFIGNQPKGSRAYLDACSKRLVLDIGLPHRGAKNVLINLLRSFRFMKSSKMQMPEFSVTSNLPSLLRGGKDFSSWTRIDRKLYRTVRGPVESVLGRYGAGLGDIALGESLFEKGKTDKFELLTLLARGLMEAEASGTPELCFVAKAVTARDYASEGDMDAAVRLMETFYADMKKRRIDRLLPNIEALLIRFYLMRGETYRVAKWMEEKAPDENERFYTLERYRYLVKARCYIQQRRYMEAASLLGRLLDYTDRFQRTLDGIETRILMAIALHEMEEGSWNQVLAEALQMAEPYGFARVFAEEGAALRPLLEELGQTTDSVFEEKVRKAVNVQAMHYPKYLKPAEILRDSLTAMESNVLELIVQGMKNEEIAAFLRISINTVKFHIKNLYSKLQVNNRAQILQAAQEYKLI